MYLDLPLWVILLAWIINARRRSGWEKFTDADYKEYILALCKVEKITSAVENPNRIERYVIGAFRKWLATEIEATAKWFDREIEVYSLPADYRLW